MKKFVDAKKVGKKGIADLRFFILFGKIYFWYTKWGDMLYICI
jgi:hypothetical protein